MLRLYKLFFCLVIGSSHVFIEANPRRILVLEPLGMAHQAETWPGFFASFLSVIGGLDYYEKNHYAGCKVQFKWGLYQDKRIGQDWWEYYFEPIRIGVHKNLKTKRLSNDHRHDLAFRAMSSISRERAYELITKYIRIKQHIHNKVDTFVQENFNNKYVIAIHYRGTDKSLEAPRVPYEKVCNALDKVILELPAGTDYILFIASDEQNFIDHMKAQYPFKICYLDAIRSRDGKPIHVNQPNPYKQGEEALIDCMLLSKAHILIRTHSNVGASAGNFNPQLPMITLNSHGASNLYPTIR